MTLLQFAIGALNDVQDRHADRLSRPAKPIPAGSVPVGGARLVAAGAAVLGLVLAAPSGWLVLGLAMVVLAIGGLYDLALKGTAWSWVPFAIGIPLLPVYGWLGAADGLPALFVVLIPVGVLEGAALAIANALVDVERDREAGLASVATTLGRRVSGVVVLVLQAAVGGVAVVTAVGLGVPRAWLALVAGASLIVVAGAATSVPSSAPAGRRAAAWTTQAVGAGAVAVGWIGGAVAAGAMG